MLCSIFQIDWTIEMDIDKRNVLEFLYKVDFGMISIIATTTCIFSMGRNYILCLISSGLAYHHCS